MCVYIVLVNAGLLQGPRQGNPAPAARHCQGQVLQSLGRGKDQERGRCLRACRLDIAYGRLC